MPKKSFPPFHDVETEPHPDNCTCSFCRTHRMTLNNIANLRALQKEIEVWEVICNGL